MNETNDIRGEAFQPYSALAELWAPRMLAIPGMLRDLDGLGRLGAVGAVLDLELEGASEVTKAREMAERIRRRLAAAEAAERPPAGPLFDNLAALGDRLGLDPVDQGILAFKALLEVNPLLMDFADLNVGRLYRGSAIIAAALGVPADRVHKALGPEGMLVKSRIVVTTDMCNNLAFRVRLRRGTSDALMREWERPDDIIRFWARPAAKPARIDKTSFPHLREETRLLARHLQRAATRRQAGVNVLLHGRQGVGKTELARILVEDSRLHGYEVPIEDADGCALSGKDRLDAYWTAQQLFCGSKPSLLIFDEMEDALPDRTHKAGDEDDESPYRKGWMNRLLEENPLPAIWISNRVRHIDPAYLRRFDYVLEVPVPPRSARGRLLAAELGSLGVRSEWIDRVAENECLAPAVVARTAAFVRSVGLDQPVEIERTCERAWRQRLSVGGEGLLLGRTPRARYEPAFVNATPGLDGLTEGLARGGCGSLLLYGPPGTGKTALAAHLAHRLDRPLMARRASELMSMWVGGTERNLARMFQQAADEGAILLLDEADSFLQDRALATRSWEVTEVNELLTQIEQFEGVLVCATNLIERLDPAAMRRFPFKFRFDYLGIRQRWPAFLHFFGQQVAALDNGAETRLRHRVEALERLTPGDFSAVKARQAVRGEPMSAFNILDALEEECRLKPGGWRKAIGFAPQTNS